MGIKPAYTGTVSSWTIVSPSRMIKHSDVSVFSHGGTAIPKSFRWFWGADTMELRSNKKIGIVYCGIRYSGTIILTITDRTQMFWNADLKNLLNAAEFGSTSMPDLVFEKMGTDEYSLHIYNTFGNNLYIPIQNQKEGRAKCVHTTKYERDARNRIAAIQVHGLRCQVCGFDFGKTYGTLGEGFIEVHHIKPLHYLSGEEIEINPKTDLVCLCSNCHRMIHRRAEKILSIVELKQLLANQKNDNNI